MRCVDPTGLQGVPPYGQGVSVDLRHLINDNQKNVYRIRFRRTDPEGTGMTLSWPAGLAAVSGGGFYMTDGFGGILFPAVDMTAADDIHIPARV